MDLIGRLKKLKIGGDKYEEARYDKRRNITDGVGYRLWGYE